MQRNEFLIATSMLVSTSGIACESEDGDTTAGDTSSASAGADTSGVGSEFSPAGMHRHLAKYALGTTYAEFATATQGLAVELDGYIAALAADPFGASPLPAQAAWRTAMVAWQRAEVMQVGPAASSLDEAGGRDLRDEIYSWPTTNTCRIDQEIVSGDYLQPGFVESELVNVYGLDAVEYLLFHDGPENTCASLLEINQGPWEALGWFEIRTRRAAYARAITTALIAHANALSTGFGDAGEFTAEWTQLGSPGSPYANATELENGLFRALFYLDAQAKDAKLGSLTATHGHCVASVCPDALESRWADHGKENLIANLEGAQRLLTARSPDGVELGFDAYLRSKGAHAIADDLAAKVEAARIRLQGLPGSLGATLQTHPAEIDAIYADVKAITDVLKGPFVLTLALQIPQEGAGDND